MNAEKPNSHGHGLWALPGLGLIGFGVDWVWGFWGSLGLGFAGFSALALLGFALLYPTYEVWGCGVARGFVGFGFAGFEVCRVFGFGFVGFRVALPNLRGLGLWGGASEEENMRKIRSFLFGYCYHYIHANPKAAGMQRGFFYDFSNYGSYERLTNDGLTEWHPAFLALGATLEWCAAAYRRFCERYQPKPKPERRSQWGSKLLAKIVAERRARRRKHKISPGQKSLWEDWDEPFEEIKNVSEKFKAANQFPPYPK